MYLVFCPLPANPNNGVINCSLGDDGVPSYEDTCSFTCNTGYELTGSDTRTCQSDGSWSGGSDVVCRRGSVAIIFSIVCILIEIELFQCPVHPLLFLIMERSIVHWEMMEFLPMKTLVVSHVTLVMS